MVGGLESNSVMDLRIDARPGDMYTVSTSRRVWSGEDDKINVLKSTIIGYTEKRDIVTVLARYAGFARVLTRGGLVGWVEELYLKERVG